MRWPGKIKAGHVVQGMSTHVDVLPTLARLLDWNIEEPLDGLDLSEQAIGRSTETPRRATVAHMTEDLRCIH